MQVGCPQHPFRTYQYFWVLGVSTYPHDLYSLTGCASWIEYTCENSSYMQVELSETLTVICFVGRVSSVYNLLILTAIDGCRFCSYLRMFSL